MLWRREAKLSTCIRPGGPLACSYSAENLALCTGLEMCLRKGIRCCSLLVCSDSQANLPALCGGPMACTGVLPRRLWHLLLQLAKRDAAITLQHVYSYCGVERNELADAAAALGRQLPGQRKAPVWLSDFVSATKRFLRDRAKFRHVFQNTWRCRIVGTEPAPKSALTMARKDATLLAQLRTNECVRVGRLAHRMGISMCTSCRWCCPEEHAAASAPVAVPRTKGNQRWGDPRQCPACATVISNTSNLITHMMRAHDVDRAEARRRHAGGC
jgi:hypothetical protein